MVLKAFLSRCPPERRAALERFLPEKERKNLNEMPSFEEEVTIHGFTNGGMLEKVHWSWFLPTLKTHPEREQKLFLAALSPYAARNLAKVLNISPSSESVREVALSYFRQILLNSLLGSSDRLLPVDYLPSSPLKPLLNFSKKKLTRLIDLLALSDLNLELRQIVETKMLKKIYSFLSEEERKILKTSSGHFESGHRMGLDRWDGTKESFRSLLHRRGLARLGAALSGQDPDFVWYICHQLDIGRGNALFKLWTKDPLPGVSEEAVRQVKELLEQSDII